MESVDVVVVGAGSAGCAAAARLVERSDLRVCLLEAGPDYGSLADGRWPAELLDAARMPRTHDWGYSETRNGELRPESRAKVVGGCSAHNQCAAAWGQPEDYDNWRIPGWTFADLEPRMREVDRLIAPEPSPEAELASWQRTWLDTAVEAGFPRLANVGQPGIGEGAAPFHANIRDGIRWNAAFAFLDGTRNRPNLEVRGGAYVERLARAGGRVTATCRGDAGRFAVSARSCVLCAGTYGSASILLRSGIGGEHVGANLHDHSGIRVRFRPSPEALRHLERDFADNRFRQSQVIVRARTGRADAFDLHLAPFQTQTDEGDWTFQVLAFLLAPRSRGRLTVNGDIPVIDFGYLSDPEDELALEDALALVRRLTELEPLAGAIEAELEPAEAGVHSTLTGYAHAVGTCALGTVVDEDCRVRENDNVYVADASIIPTIPRANPNLTCFLIGLKAADLLAKAS